MGVGGENSWGAQPLPHYRLRAKHYSYAFVLEMSSQSNDLVQIRNKPLKLPVCLMPDIKVEDSLIQIRSLTANGTVRYAWDQPVSMSSAIAGKSLPKRSGTLHLQVFADGLIPSHQLKIVFP